MRTFSKQTIDEMESANYFGQDESAAKIRILWTAKMQGFSFDYDHEYQDEVFDMWAETALRFAVDEFNLAAVSV